MESNIYFELPSLSEVQKCIVTLPSCFENRFPPPLTNTPPLQLRWGEYVNIINLRERITCSFFEQYDWFKPLFKLMKTRF